MIERIDNDDNSVENLIDHLLSEDYFLPEETEGGDDDDPTYNQLLQEKVLVSLDGEYRELRDDTHINPHAVLVFTEGADGEPDTVEAVDLCELPLKHPIKGRHARWCAENLGELVASKAFLYRQSRLAHELAEEDPKAEPVCGVPVLAVPMRPGPYYWFEMKARVLPESERG
jgi:hypothetical protein